MSLAEPYFEHLYAVKGDPWSLESRWYDARKYALTIASLRRSAYRRGFEPGCSVGVLTAMLASRCEELLATDLVPLALQTTAERLELRPWVEIRKLKIPDEWPEGSFDLIVLSELAYYLSSPELDRLIVLATRSLASDGDLVVVHWRHRVEDYPLTGDEVHARFRRTPFLKRVAGHSEADFLLDVFGHPGTPSVAAREGLA
jgi:cyclopropane fatty-acyl-phospholipid synthase-like methyltransferase